MTQELIIGLVNHRKLGRLFQAFLIEPQGEFYTVVKLLRRRDIDTLELDEKQRELVRLAEKLSDEELTKRFSRRMEPTNFINHIDPVFFKEHINPYIDRQLTGMIQILMQGGTRLFSKDDKYSNLYDEDVIEVASEFMDCRMRFVRTLEGGIDYRLQLYQEGEYFPLFGRKLQFLVMTPAAYIFRNKLYVLKKLESSKMLPFLTKKDVHVPPSSAEKYCHSFIKQSIAEHKVKVEGFQLLNPNAERMLKLTLEESLHGNLVLVPRFHYGEKVFLPNQKQEVEVEVLQQGEQFVFVRTKRDREWEKSQLQEIEKWGLVEKYGVYAPNGSQMLDAADASLALFDWLDEHEEQLNSGGVVCSSDDGAARFSRLRGELEFKMEEKEDWFDVRIKVRFGEYDIPFIKLKDHIRMCIREFELPNGEIVILPAEWFTRYKDLFEVAELKGESMRVRKYHYSLLQKAQKGMDKQLIARLQELEDTESLVSSPTALQANLRTYQHQGFSWLYHLYEKQFGACLADDMGLGKTLQTIALLLKLKRQKKTLPKYSRGEQRSLFDELDAINAFNQQEQAASLIVMPTSLIYNWRNELSKFAPDLKVYTHYGAQRQKNNSFQHLSNLYDVILTTYGTVRNDLKQMKDFSFFYLILDESQYIKNPESKIYQAIIQLKAQHKMVLTGTPIENSLSDLWAQMNFINPGLLGNHSYFKREFIHPIERKNNEEKQDKLQLLIRPFILRRTKMEVAKDLPPITEQIRYCKMTKSQHQIYEQEKSAIRYELLRKIATDGMAQSSMQILQGLSRLRQLANHPLMLGMDEEIGSGKFKVITETLRELIDEKHKVLIFSSFVKHLDLVKHYLEEEGLRYAMLTGATRNRAEVIEDFQQDDANRVFLISLKAGGVGLNLTQADYVFILDPWWNPAAEQQAISRAHRIGQDKKVMVYRFISEGSIEEKIINMQERKSDLANKFVNSNNPFQAISQEELMSLF